MSAEPSASYGSGENLAHQAGVNARLMTLRGFLIHIISFGAGVLLLALVTPVEYGLLAVVRATVGLVWFGVDSTLALPLLRQQRDPTRHEYAALAGAQLLIVLVFIAAAFVWPDAVLGFGAVRGRWFPWMLATLVTLLLVPFGSGARTRLERSLTYSRLAFVDVSSVLLHSLLLLTAALLGRFAHGVFIAQIAFILYRNALFYRWSPGPRPLLSAGHILRRLAEGAGFSVAYSLALVREHGIPILIAKLFGLRSAGFWALAGRVGLALQFAFESFGRVATAVAPRLRHDQAALRALAATSLRGAASLTLPVAALLFVSLPALLTFWPQWREALSLVQVYVLLFSLAGVVGAGLLPVLIALRGWRVVLIENLVQMIAAYAAVMLLWWSGGDNLALVVPAIQLSAIAAILLMADRSIWPSPDPELVRPALSLLAGLSLYAVADILDVPAVVGAVLASAGIALVVSPLRYLRVLRARLGGS